ncbi:hypothetical protein SVAN01_02450 [Stagonosporopsis vannaccii]|nr:hypothetical protein SVAN01_02450 [Stagonosporopsis vannaccii]
MMVRRRHSGPCVTTLTSRAFRTAKRPRGVPDLCELEVPFRTLYLVPALHRDSLHRSPAPVVPPPTSTRRPLHRCNTHSPTAAAVFVDPNKHRSHYIIQYYLSAQPQRRRRHHTPAVTPLASSPPTACAACSQNCTGF